MVTIKNVQCSDVYYDVEVGYYTLWRYQQLHCGFFPIHNIKVPGDDERKYCVLCPALPYYDLNKSSFSSGTLKSKFDRFDFKKYRLRRDIRLDVIQYGD